MTTFRTCSTTHVLGKAGEYTDWWQGYRAQTTISSQIMTVVRKEQKARAWSTRKRLEWTATVRRYTEDKIPFLHGAKSNLVLLVLNSLASSYFWSEGCQYKIEPGFTFSRFIILLDDDEMHRQCFCWWKQTRMPHVRRLHNDDTGFITDNFAKLPSLQADMDLWSFWDICIIRCRPMCVVKTDIQGRRVRCTKFSDLHTADLTQSLQPISTAGLMKLPKSNRPMVCSYVTFWWNRKMHSGNW